MFKVGDIVQLKSGGPIMTVVDTRSLSCTCSWFSNNEPQNHNYPFDALKAHEEPATTVSIC